MTVNTKKVEGRRELHYSSFEEFLSDAERMSAADVQPIGNWSAGQVFEHLTRTMKCSMDGFPKLFPAPLRFVMKRVMLKRLLKKGLPAGFKSPSAFVADATDAAPALATMKEVIARLQQEPNRAPHPGFGTITREEWDTFHLRHAELHMSFLTTPTTSSSETV